MSLHLLSCLVKFLAFATAKVVLSQVSAEMLRIAKSLPSIPHFLCCSHYFSEELIAESKYLRIFASQSERKARHIAQILLSNHHLTTRIKERTNTTLKLRMSADFTIVVLGLVVSLTGDMAGLRFLHVKRVCATLLI